MGTKLFGNNLGLEYRFNFVLKLALLELLYNFDNFIELRLNLCRSVKVMVTWNAHPLTFVHGCLSHENG